MSLEHSPARQRKRGGTAFAYDLLTFDDLAERLHCSRKTVKKNYTKWGLRPVRIAGKVLFPSTQLAALEKHLSTRDPYAFVLSVNAHRRHLTTEQKRDLIAAVMKAPPDKSNRTIAKQTRADHKTVGTVRAELEGRGEIPHVAKVTDTKGRCSLSERRPSRARLSARPAANCGCAPRSRSFRTRTRHFRTRSRRRTGAPSLCKPILPRRTGLSATLTRRTSSRISRSIISLWSGSGRGRLTGWTTTTSETRPT